MNADPPSSLRNRLRDLDLPVRALLAYGLFTLGIFVIALLYLLPHAEIARIAIGEATRSAPISLRFADVSFAFPNGYRFEAIRVSPREQPGRQIMVDELTVWIPLSSLLLGRTDTVAFSGELWGGSIDGIAGNADGRISSSVQLQDVRLQPLSRLLLDGDGSLGGRASVDLELSGDGRTTRSSAGRFELSARDVSLQGIVVQGFVVPDLTFSDIRARADLETMRLRIQEARADGEELDLSARGEVLLRDPTPRSVLNLQFEIDVSEGARPGLRMIPALLPSRRPGQGQKWTLSGSLAAPRVN